MVNNRRAVVCRGPWLPGAPTVRVAGATLPRPGARHRVPGPMRGRSQDW